MLAFSVHLHVLHLEAELKSHIIPSITSFTQPHKLQIATTIRD